MNKISEKKAHWVDELPRNIKVLMKNARINALIENFKKTNDPYCLALLCDYISPKKNEKKALQTIKDFAIKSSHKKGLRYEYQKSQILYLWDLLNGRASNAKVYTAISTECGMSEDAIRKIIKNI
jgi:hypothetical protein